MDLWLLFFCQVDHVERLLSDDIKHQLNDIDADICDAKDHLSDEIRDLGSNLPSKYSFYELKQKVDELKDHINDVKDHVSDKLDHLMNDLAGDIHSMMETLGHEAPTETLHLDDKLDHITDKINQQEERHYLKDLINDVKDLIKSKSDHLSDKLEYLRSRGDGLHIEYGMFEVVYL